jgi:hypothetical protein
LIILIILGEELQGAKSKQQLPQQIALTSSTESCC